MYSLFDFPDEIIVNIFSYFKLKKLIFLEQVCQSWKFFIRLTRWNHLVKLSDIEIIRHVASNYHFVNYDLSFCELIDDDLKLFSNSYSLILCYQQTIPSVDAMKLIANVPNITFDDWVSSQHIEMLTNIRKLKIIECANIGDNSLTKLTKLESLSEKGNLTDQGICQLTKLRRLHLWKSSITDWGLTHLNNLRSLTLSECHLITDYSIQKLHQLDFLHIFKCDNITGSSFQYLINLRTLKIVRAKNIFQLHLSSMKHLHLLQIIECGKIIDESLMYSNAIQKLKLSSVNINGSCLEYFKNLQYLFLSGFGIRIDSRYVEYLSNLNTLTIIGTKITPVDDIKKLNMISDLTLRATNITDDEISCLTAVRSLDIAYCKGVTDKSIPYLMNKIKLNIKNTSISPLMALELGKTINKLIY